MNEKKAVKKAKEMLNAEKVDYSNNSIYGAALMLDSYFEDTLTTKEALNEYLQNTEHSLKVVEK